MKINKTNAGAIPAVGEHEIPLKPEKLLNGFAVDLLKTQDKHSQERLHVLLEQITVQGKKLAKVPTYTELKSYRELVSRFIGEAVGNMYEVQSQTGWDRQGRQKMYTTIKKIDTAMEALTEDVRAGQGRELDILAKQDAIRGLLVDLYT